MTEIYVVFTDSWGSTFSNATEPVRAFRDKDKAEELAATGAGGFYAVVHTLELEEDV